MGTTTPNYPKDLTLEQVWASITELREEFKNELREERRKVQEELREERRKVQEELLEERRKDLEKQREYEEKQRKEREKELEKQRKEHEKDQEKQKEYEEKRKKAQEEYEKKQEKAREELRRQMKETDRKIGDLGNRFGELFESEVAPGIMRKFNELGFNFDEHSENKEIVDRDNPNVYTEVDILLENSDIVIAVEIKIKPKRSDINKHIQRMELLRQRADRRGDQRIYRGAIAGAIMKREMRDYVVKNGFYLIEPTGDTVKVTIPEGFVPREWHPLQN